MDPSKQPTVQSHPTPHPRNISSERTERRTRFCKKVKLVVYISKRVSISFQYMLPRSLRRQTCQIHGCYITNRQPTETSRVQQHTAKAFAHPKAPTKGWSSKQAKKRRAMHRNSEKAKGRPD